MQKYLDELYAPYHLAGLQHAFLTIICRNPGIQQKELQKWFFIDPSNIARNLAALEKMNYIVRKSDESDKRNRTLYPTESAIAIYDTIGSLYIDALKKMTAGFTEDETKLLISFLDRIFRNISLEER